MKKQHFLFKIWRIAYPMIIHYGSLVALTFIGALVISLSIGYQIGVQDARLSENLISYILSNQLLRYAVLLTGLGNLAAIPLLSLFMRLDKRKYPEGKLIEKANPVTYIFVVLAGFFFCIGLNQLITLSQLAYHFTDYSETMASIYLGNIWEEIICVAILAPIGEELCFRGLVFKRLRGYVRFIPAMLISSLLFGIYHGNVVQGCYAFCLGCVLAYVHEKYQNVIAPIIVHLVANTISVLSTETSLFNFLFRNWSTVITSMIVFLICGILMLVAIKITVTTEREAYIPPYIPPMAMPNNAMLTGYAAPIVPIHNGNLNLQAMPVYTTLPDGMSPNGISCPVGMMTPQGFVPLYYLMPQGAQPMMQMPQGAPEETSQKVTPEVLEMATQEVPQDAELQDAIPEMEAQDMPPVEEAGESTAPEAIGSDEVVIPVPPSQDEVSQATSVLDNTVQDEALLDDFFVQEFELDD